MLIGKLEKSLLTILSIILLNMSMSGCTVPQENSSNKSKKEFNKAFGDLYLITLVIDYMGKEYEKETFPLFDDCEKGMKAAERTFKKTPVMKLKKIKCIPLEDAKLDKHRTLK